MTDDLMVTFYSEERITPREDWEGIEGMLVFASFGILPAPDGPILSERLGSWDDI